VIQSWLMLVNGFNNLVLATYTREQTRPSL
jgi:hypothetical protein